MPWDSLPSYLGSAGIFLLGLVAPSVKTLTDQFVAGTFKRREKKAEIIETRADAAADACLRDLSLAKIAIRDYSVFHRAVIDREEAQDKESARRHLEDSVATLEAHSALLPKELRASLTVLASILKYAHDLPYERSRMGRFGWHPDSAVTIGDNAARYGSEILSAYLRRDTQPLKPDVIIEYELATDDRNEELSDEFAPEIQESADEQAQFRKKHDLTAERKPWPK
ncbi:hypothetical protein [Pengzhenrongella phosphoraccumulans]|uniref:hypothetical protein n=1 Tax=Pengzhenrongella phosphoraccumulans TaxID=3114394 RepID=UPI00388E33A7